MKKYVIRRALGLIPTLFIIITVSFFIIRLAPGGPFAREKAVPDEILRNLERKYHMDDPLVVQYGRYLFDVLRFDLGPSFRYKDHDVNSLIAGSLPNSLILGLVSLGAALTLGIAAGIVSALKQNRLVDYTFMSVATVGISIPLFVVGPVLMLVFAMRLGWLPTSGWITGRYGMQTLIMPAVTLTLPYFAYIARLSRASFLDVLRSDYVRTARAKGLPGGIVIFRHVIRGGLLPVVSYIGPAFAQIVTGSVVVEQIFRVPGLGKFFVQSAINRDYTLVMGTVIVYSVILILMNFFVDLLYGYLDPRVSYD
ncbi:MAG: ABC transporter permease subunit [Spirochaetales bacterium]|nr:ABC transporter permease subunit [Spirochaetales bacterium]MCF7938186.1 ABC transporter permease subunit [Spirochaetales bacterium]